MLQILSKISIRNSASTLKTLFFAAIAFLAISCNKTPQHAYHVPKQASLVVTIDTKKLAWNAISFDDLFKAGSDTSKDEMGAKLQDSGIDLLSKTYLFSTGEIDKAPMSAIFAITDASKFKTFLQNTTAPTFSEADGITFADNGKYVFAFNDKMAVVSGNTDGAVDIKKHVSTILALEKGNALLENDENFKKTQEHGAAITLWVSLEAVQSQQLNMPVGKKALKESYMTAFMEFENGKFVTEGNFFTKNEEAKKYGDLMSENIDTDLIGEIPSKAPVGIVAVKFNVKTLEKLLTDLGVKGTMEGGLGMAGISTDDFFKMLSGDIVLSVTDGTAESATPQFFVNIGIADKKILDKILTSLSSQAVIKDNKTYFNGGMLPASISIVASDKKLTVTSSEKMREDVLSGKGDKLEGKIVDMAKNSAIFGFVDYDMMVAKIPQMSTDDAKLATQYLHSFVFTAKQKSLEHGEAVFTLNTKPENENSFRTLARFGQASKKLSDKRMEEYKTLYGSEDIIDSAAVEAAAMEADSVASVVPYE